MRLAPRWALLIALAMGAVATLMVRAVIQGMASSSGESGRTIVVSRAALAPGTPLTRDNLREIAWRASEPLDGSFPTVADLLKDGRRLALVSLQKNEPVLASRVTAPGGRATLSGQLDEGMRAVTVRVDEVRGVAGFVLPGDRVDVILTRGEGGQEANAYADVLLQGAKVLAVDQLVDERQDKPAIARAVTLELTVQQAQKVVLAQGIGRLSLALRQASAAADAETSRVTAGDLGLDAPVVKDRVAELEARLADLRTSAEAARVQSERNQAQKLSEFEARIRTDAARPAPAQQARPEPAASVVTVIRNGGKSESYNVAAER